MTSKLWVGRGSSLKLLDKDDTLKSELTQLQEFNYCLEDNLDFENYLTVNERQIINYVLHKNHYKSIFEYQNESVFNLIAENLETWAQDLISKAQFEYRNCDVEFRTDNHGDLDFKSLSEQNAKPTGMYLILGAPNGSTVMAEIEFENFNESTDSIIKFINNAKLQMTKEIQRACNDFDPDEEFNALWGPQLDYSARNFLAMLDEDQKFFQDRLQYI